MTKTKTKLFNSFFKNNLECQDSLNKLRDPLKRNFGIDDFWHLTVHENGHLANMSTFYDQWGYFWDTECYRNTDFLIAPSCLKAGCFQLDYDHNFVKIIDSFSTKYPQYHPLIIIRKEGKEKAHIFGFAARQQRPSLPSFYMNNLAVLNSFLNYHLSVHAKCIKRAEENMIDIAALRGRNHFYKQSYGQESLPNIANSCNFLKHIGIDPLLLEGAKSLSFREKQVLVACSDRKTAAQNGNELGLSHRTIQFYLNNAKNKLGIITREELMQSIDVLKMAGLL